MSLPSVLDYCRLLYILKKYKKIFFGDFYINFVKSQGENQQKAAITKHCLSCPWVPTNVPQVLANQSSGALPFRLCLCEDLVGVVAGAGLGGGGQAAGGGGDHGHGLRRVLRGVGRGALCEHRHCGEHRQPQPLPTEPPAHRAPAQHRQLGVRLPSAPEEQEHCTGHGE